jgi:hypothetical protein
MGLPHLSPVIQCRPEAPGISPGFTRQFHKNVIERRAPQPSLPVAELLNAAEVLPEIPAHSRVNGYKLSTLRAGQAQPESKK